jgi:hypothetical protein
MIIQLYALYPLKGLFQMFVLVEILGPYFYLYVLIIKELNHVIN